MNFNKSGLYCSLHFKSNRFKQHSFCPIVFISAVRTCKDWSHLPDSGYVCIIPSVVIHKNCSVCHCCYLIPIIPPRHHFGILEWINQATRFICVLSSNCRLFSVRKKLKCHLSGVVSQPIVSLSEIVEYDSPAVSCARRQNDGGWRIRFRCHPNAVERVRRQEECHHANHSKCNLKSLVTDIFFERRRIWMSSDNSVKVPVSCSGHFCRIFFRWVSSEAGNKPHFSLGS